MAAMSSIALLTVFGALQAIPTIMALAQGAKDGATKGILIAGTVTSLILALSPYIDQIGDMMNGNMIRAMAVACGILGLLTLVRVPNRVLGTLAVVGGSLAALLALGIIG